MASNNLSAWERMKEKTRAQQAERGVKQALSAAPKQVEAKKEAETFFSSVGERENSVFGQMLTDDRMDYRAESRNDNSLWKQTEKDRAELSQYTEKLMKDLNDQLTKYRADNDTDKITETQNRLTELQKQTDTHWTDRVGNTVVGALKQSAGAYGSAFAVSSENVLDGDRKTVRGESAGKVESLFDKNKVIQYTQGVRDKTLALTQSGAANIEQAKKGLGTVGRLAVDTAAGLTQLGTDILIGGATHVGAMPVLAVRAFGGAADQAKMEGASVDQQVAYGLASAAVEVFAERLSSYNLILDKAHGKSPFSIDKLLDGVVAGIEDIATTPGGRALMNRVGSILASGMGEGFEEAISGIAEPFLSSGIYGKEFNMDIKEIGYQVLIGALTGAVTGISGKSTLDYRVSKADESHGQVIRDTGVTPKIVQNALHTDKNSEAYKMADAIRSRKAPATNEELGKLNRLTINQLIKEAEAVEKAQSADLGQPVVTDNATILDRGTTAYLDLAMANAGQKSPAKKSIKRAEAKAKVVQKLIDGDEVSLDDMKILNLTDATYRAIFTQLTGVQFPEGLTNLDQLINIAKTANTVSRVEQVDPGTPVNVQNEVQESIAQPIAQDIAQVSDDAQPLSYEQFGEAYRRTEGADLSIDEPTMRSVYDSYLEHENQTVMESGAPVTRTQFRNNLRKTEAGAKMSDREIDRYFDSYRESQTEAPRDLRHKLSKDVQDVIAAFEKKLGIRIEVTESIRSEKTGQIAEGVSDTGVIRLALDARGELSYDEAVMQVLRHEVTHQLKRAVSKDTYNAFAKYVREFDSEFYQTQYEQVSKTYAKQFKDSDDTKKQEAIDDEVIARCAEKLFEDEAFIRMVVGKNRTLAEKIHDIFEKLLKKLNLTGEAKKQLLTKRDLWAAMLNEAEENTKAGVAYDKKTESFHPAQFSLDTWNESDYVTARANAAKAMSEALGITQKKAKDYIDSVNSIAKMIANDRVRLDYEASPGRSSFVSNAEYGGSIDFSTICKKRRLFTGTFEAIQRALPNTALTAEEFLEIRSMMDEKGYEVSCGLCYVEGSRAKMGQYTKQFLERYAATNPEYVPTMAEMNTATGQEQIRREHPEVYEAYERFMNNYGRLNPTDKAIFASQQKPKMYQMSTAYQGEILNKFGRKSSKVTEKNLNGGLRIQSFSDFEIIHLIDMMQVIMDMSRVGLAGQAYTKVPDFAWALGDTGLKINLSLITKGLDENGKLILDEKEGMSAADAFALRDRYSENIGTILVVYTDDQLKAALADDRIDYIIPFHKSQWKMDQYELMGIPAEAKNFNYEKLQNESYIKPVLKNGKKQRPENFMPNTYWDFSKSGKENAETYLRMCAEDNRRPKFHHLLVDNKDGSYALQPDGSTDGYWKLLIDFKMYDNDGKGVPQRPVRPDFNMEQAYRMLADYKGGHSRFPAADDVVSEFVEQYKRNHPGEQLSLSDEHSEITDEEYLSAVERDDMETAQRMVDEAAKAAGYPAKLYHGTPQFGFTRADVSKSDDKISFFATDSLDVAETYSGKGKVKAVSDDANDDIDAIEEAFRDKQTDLCEYINRVAGYQSYIKYDAFAKYWEDAAFGSVSMDYLRDGFYEEIETIIQELFPYSEYYEHMNDDVDQDELYEQFEESDEVQRIYSAANDLEFIFRAARSDRSGNYQLYANTDNLFELDAKGKSWAQIPFDEYDKNGFHPYVNTRQAAAYAKAEGFAGVKISNVFDDGGRSTKHQRTPATVYIFFKPQEQIKSADPVTYDDNGNVIPLSKRFDSSNEDIRYSFADEVAYIVGGSYNTTGKYWKPDFGQAEWNLWNRTVKREVNTTDQYVIDDSTKWLYAEEKGVRVFGLYSTNDPEDPTLLYASSGVNARTEYQDFTEFREGKRDASVRKRKKTALDRVFDAIESWGSRADADLHLAENRRAEMGDVPVPATQSGSDRGSDSVEVQADPQLSLADDLTPAKRKAFIETFDAEFGEGAAEQMFKAHDQMARAAARAEKRAVKAAESKIAAETLAKEKSERDLTAFLMYHNRKLREQQRKYADDKAKLQKAKAEAVKEAVETTKLVERAKADIRVQATEMHLGKKAAEQKRTGNDKIADLKAEAADRLRVTKKAYRDEMSRAAKLQRNAAKHLLSDKKAAERRKNEIQTAQGPVNTIRQNPRERVKVEKMKALAQELRTRGRTAYRYFVNQAQEIDNFAKRQKGGIYASTLVNVLGGSSSTVESIFKNGLVDRSGNRIGESLKDVLLCMDATGKKVDEAKQALLQDYILHLHNIDRMSFVAKAKARLDAFEGNPENAWLVGLDIKDLAILVAATDKETADAIFDKYGKVKKGKSGWTEADRQLAWEYASLLHNFLEAKDKPVFADENGNDVTADTSREIVAKYEKDNAWLIDKANGIFEWWDLFMRNWAVGDSLSLAEYETMHETYPHYAPTYRVDKAGPGGAVSVSGTAATVGKATKAAKGSTLEIVPIEDSFANIASKIVRLARVNELYMNIIDTAMLDEEGLFSDMAVFDWDWQTGEYGKALQLQAILNGETEAEIEESTKTGLEKIGDDYKLTGWSHGRKYSAQISKELYQSIADTTGATDEQLKKLTKLGNILTGPMKTAITGVNPFFAIRNLSRDIPSAIINSTGGKFPKYWAQAIAEMKSNSENWQAFKALGGTNAGYYNNEKGFVDAMAKRPGVVKTAIEGLGWINNVTEAATRFAEYLSTIDRMGDTYEARLQGIKNSAEVTVDFSRKGSYGKFINAWVPYWNPAVQGIDKMIRSVIESPDGSAIWKQATKTLGRAATQTILFEAILQAVLHALDRDDEWEKLSDRDKAAYYCIPLWDEHKFLKIAKNREWGAILGTPFMLILEGLDGRQNPFENYVETALEPNFLPGAILRPREDGGFTSDVIGVSQALDLAYNEDFAGRTIIPYALQQGSKTEQYDSETSRLSVALGKLINFSPMQIDYIVKDYFGDFGELFTGLTAPGTYDVAPEQAMKNAWDTFTGSFHTDNRYSNQTVSTYYETLDELGKVVNDKKNQMGTEAHKQTKEYKTQKGLQEMYGNRITELNKQVRGLPDGTDKDALKEEIAQLAGLAMDFYKQAMSGEIKEPLLTVTYANLPESVSNELIRLDSFAKDYAFEPTNNTTAKYTDPEDKQREYILDDESKEKRSEIYSRTYGEVMGEIMNKSEYRKANDQKKVEMLEEARDSVAKLTKDEFLDWLAANRRSTLKK